LRARLTEIRPARVEIVPPEVSKSNSQLLYPAPNQASARVMGQLVGQSLAVWYVIENHCNSAIFSGLALALTLTTGMALTAAFGFGLLPLGF
jgi:hypothetical protein